MLNFVLIFISPLCSYCKISCFYCCFT